MAKRENTQDCVKHLKFSVLFLYYFLQIFSNFFNIF